MKTAQFRYRHLNLDISVNIYFDLKAFDFLKPVHISAEEDHFIWQISDSMAAAMLKDGSEKNFYIKRVVKHTSANNLKIFCTDGFLIDIALVIPITEQAFANERIKIIEVEQLPSRLKLSNEILKTMNDRLPLFEEEVRKDIAEGRITAVKETIKAEKPLTAAKEYETDKTLDIFAEIGNSKKEIKEIAEHSRHALALLLRQVNEIRQLTNDEIMKETRIGLVEEDNKKKLDAFAKYTISQFGGNDIEKSKELLNNKIEEITPIPSTFDKTIEVIINKITKQTDNLSAFKQHLIIALYDSAKEYYQNELSKNLQSAAPNTKKIMIKEFNKKFANVAALTEKNELTSIEEAQKKLSSLSLETLQEIVSNEDKENLGILQKCNTSWIEESPELKILMKNLSQLNSIFSQLFKNSPQYERYAQADMVQIIRVPFPRSFQFSFTQQALEYKKSVEDFCKIQKETIGILSMEYKKALQIDDVRDKTERAMLAIKKQTEAMKRPIMEYRELLSRKEISKNIMDTAAAEYKKAEKLLHSSRELNELVNNKIDANLKIIKKKINRLAANLQTKTDAAANAIKKITQTKSEIDILTDKANVRNAAKPNLQQLDEKIKSMTENQNIIIETNRLLQAKTDMLAFYKQAIEVSEEIAKSTAQNNMQKQYSEAKQIIVQIIKDQSRDIAATENIKKHMINLYTQIETAFNNIEKEHQAAIQIKINLFNELNMKDELPRDTMKVKLQPLIEKLAQIALWKQSINDNLAALKKLS